MRKVIATALVLLACITVYAQSYTTKPIAIGVPTGPDGSYDLVGIGILAQSPYVMIERADFAQRDAAATRKVALINHGMLNIATVVLHGWGGKQLLESYKLERRPVHLNVLKESSSNHVKVGINLFEVGLEHDTAEGKAVQQRVGKRINAEKLYEFYTLGTIQGDRYTDSPVVQRLTGTPPRRDFLNYRPDSTLGQRELHPWLHDDSLLFNHFGKRFTLLALPFVPELALQAACGDAQRLGTPFKILRSDNPSVARLSRRRLNLIRPDQHIPRAEDRWPESDEFDVLAMATGQDPQTVLIPTPEKETAHD